MLATDCIYWSCLIKAKAESDHKVLKTREVKTSHCGLVVKTLARNARDPGSIPSGRKF